MQNPTQAAQPQAPSTTAPTSTTTTNTATATATGSTVTTTATTTGNTPVRSQLAVPQLASRSVLSAVPQPTKKKRQLSFNKECMSLDFIGVGNWKLIQVRNENVELIQFGIGRIVGWI